MAEGPLTESEMAWLEETLISYGHDDASVIDVSELDGMLTAVLSGPVVVEPDTWLVAVWGGEKYIPRWKNDREMNRFIDLCFKHMNDIAERLSEYPDQFEPLFGYNDVDGQSYTVVEEWCYGYMRGVALTDWTSLPEALEADLAVIALHGTEENSEKLDALTEEEHMASIESHPGLRRCVCTTTGSLTRSSRKRKKPIVNGSKVGRNDPCPCGSGKKFKSCCLHCEKGLFIAPFLSHFRQHPRCNQNLHQNNHHPTTKHHAQQRLTTRHAVSLLRMLLAAFPRQQGRQQQGQYR